MWNIKASTKKFDLSGGIGRTVNISLSLKRKSRVPSLNEGTLVLFLMPAAGYLMTRPQHR